MVTEKFANKPFIKCDEKQFRTKAREYNAFLLYVRFYNVKPKYYNHYIQVSKCINMKNPIYDNGRVVSCDVCDMWLTDIDFDIITTSYKCDPIILETYKAHKDYLDKRIIKFILDLYGNKTKLKISAQTDEQIAEIYKTSKSQINSCYGMSVSNCLKQSSDFKNGLWTREELSPEFIKRKLDESKKSWSTLMYYASGCWITAYARRNIFMRLLEVSDNGRSMDIDSIYVDTDSLKYVNEHDDIFERYNNSLIDKYKEVIKKYPEFTLEDFMPRDEAGVERPIGFFEPDGSYMEFVSTGAKKYAYRASDGLHITISGVNKKTGVKALKDDINNFLNNDLVFTYEESQRLIHYYINDQPEFTFIDIDGNEYTSNLKYGVVLQPTTYTMGVTDSYIQLLKMYEVERAIKNGKQKT